MAKRKSKRVEATETTVRLPSSSVSIKIEGPQRRKRGWYKITVFDVRLRSVNLYYRGKTRMNEALAWLAKSKFVIDDEGTAAEVDGFRSYQVEMVQ